MGLLGTLINKFGKIAGWNSVKVVRLGRQDVYKRQVIMFRHARFDSI